jgi:hypothetical protein
VRKLTGGRPCRRQRLPNDRYCQSHRAAMMTRFI